ncbi:NAD-dependent epimerase/dehydratase family protein [Liberiplasma polymorphum]|uniref:NAD-dependent epimerase/dehydratase family protein n=1 Tax=Liberiplasma polymorphum TaxID=3374570 RepID=UPI003772DD1B
MTKILITGKDIYIGTSFEKWVSQWSDVYKVEAIDVQDDSWKKHDFSVYDVVLHVAAIVHFKKKNKNLYHKVNRDLTYEIAKKTKFVRVKQFILLSTMGIYGIEKGYVDLWTNLNPKTNYAKSKLEAENMLLNLVSNTFCLHITRPPMVYNHNCMGNYVTLSRFAKSMTFVPKFNNSRCLIYIDNLCNFLMNIIECKICGISFPQNDEYVSLSNLIFNIRKYAGKNTMRTRILNISKVFIPLSKNFSKVLGNLEYSYDMPGSPHGMKKKYKTYYNIFSFEDSRKMTEVSENGK